MTIAAYNPPPGGALGLTPVLQKVVGIRLNTANVPGLNWAIFGKVVVTNPNPNPENVVAELVAPAVLDTTNVTTPAKRPRKTKQAKVYAKAPKTNKKALIEPSLGGRPTAFFDQSGTCKALKERNFDDGK